MRDRVRRKSKEKKEDEEPTLAEYGLAIYNKLKERNQKKTLNALEKAKKENEELKAKVAAKKLEEENKKMREELANGN